MYVIAHASAPFQRDCNTLQAGDPVLWAWGGCLVEIRIKLLCKTLFPGRPQKWSNTGWGETLLWARGTHHSPGRGWKLRCPLGSLYPSYS